MKSITAEKLRLNHEPVAILWSNVKLEVLGAALLQRFNAPDDIVGSHRL